MNAAFSRHDSDIVVEAFKAAKLVKYKRGDIINQPSDELKCVYMVADGFVKVYSVNNRDEQYVHLVYDTGEIFPLVWLVNEGKRNVYYEAVTNCSIYELEKSVIADRAKTDAAFSYCLLQRVTEQFRVYADRVDNLEYKYASERLAYCLLFLASRFGERQGDKILLRVPITHQVLGSTINLSRESVTRELDKLAKKNLIEYQDRLIVIKDVAQLKAQFKRPISPNWWGLNPLLIGASLPILHSIAAGLTIFHPHLRIR
jgi:CRP/FNR family cyclic AMP-dependent transcriptional regulator